MVELEHMDAEGYMLLQTAGEDQQRCWRLSPPFEHALWCKASAVYKLLGVLHTEARLVDITCKLFTSDSVSVGRRKNTIDVQAKLLNLWEDYENGLISREELLNSAGDYTPF